MLFVVQVVLALTLQTTLTLRARTVFKNFGKNVGNFSVLVCCAAAN